MPNPTLIRCALFKRRAGWDLAYVMWARCWACGTTGRGRADVKKLASVHVEEIDQKIIELQDMRNTLVHLTDCCHGDDRPGCSVLEEVVGCA